MFKHFEPIFFDTLGSSPFLGLSAVARGGFSRGWFWIWLKIGRFRGLGDPGWLSNHPKRWGGETPTFLDGLKAPRCRPDPENDRFSAKSQNTPLLNPPLATTENGGTQKFRQAAFGYLANRCGEQGVGLTCGEPVFNNDIRRGWVPG